MMPRHLTQGLDLGAGLEVGERDAVDDGVLAAARHPHLLPLSRHVTDVTSPRVTYHHATSCYMLVTGTLLPCCDDDMHVSASPMHVSRFYSVKGYKDDSTKLVSSDLQAGYVCM